MARSQPAAATAAAKSKTHRPTRRVTSKKAPAAALFDPTEHHEEIAVAAYLAWLEQGDSPHSSEENWLRAEAEVRGRYLSS
jgi:hypothetical protein